MADDWQIDGQNDGLGDDINSNSEPKPPFNQVDKNQKIAVAGLAVFAVLIVILWSVQLKNNIYGPLNSNNTAAQEQINSQTASDLALKNKDTDSDGLSDYDELNVYKTSPYLEDADGDKIKDGEEISKGTDPNCPAGRTCSTSEFTDDNTGAASNTSASSNVLNDLSNQLKGADSGAASASTNLTSEQIEIMKNIDAASLRELLIESGMDKATLDQISDSELMQSYNESLQ